MLKKNIDIVYGLLIDKKNENMKNENIPYKLDTGSIVVHECNIKQYNGSSIANSYALEHK